MWRSGLRSVSLVLECKATTIMEVCSFVEQQIKASVLCCSNTDACWLSGELHPAGGGPLDWGRSLATGRTPEACFREQLQRYRGNLCLSALRFPW